MKNYETLSEAVNELVKQGYTLNFNLHNDSITCDDNNISIHPDDFEIDEIHRFDGMTDVDDECILYAISSIAHRVKGLLVNAYGAYSDNFSAQLVSKLTMHK